MKSILLKRKIPKLLFMLFFIALSLILFMYVDAKKNKSKSSTIVLNSRQGWSVTKNILEQLNVIWSEPIFIDKWKGLLDCPSIHDLAKKNTSDLQSNPLFLDCYFSQTLKKIQVQKNMQPPYIKVLWDKKILHFSALPRSEKLSPYKYLFPVSKNTDEKFGPKHGYKLMLQASEIPSLTLEVLLERKEQNVYLPQSQYIYGQKNYSTEPGRGDGAEDTLQLVWDTYGRDYYIDKNLVKVWEFNEYLASTHQHTRINQAVEFWFNPVSNIYPWEQEKFCAWRGQIPFNAFFYFAAVFAKNDQGQSQLSPYSWGRKKLSDLQSTNFEQCKIVYGKNCTYPYDFLNSLDNTTWMGVHQLNGGYYEYIPNILTPKFNLKMSSWDFNLSSPWHILGNFSHWNEEDFSVKSVSGISSIDAPGELSQQDLLHIGFRCVSEYFYEN